jgi:hypothetical protein
MKGESLNTINSKNRPLGIILISGFYTFGAVVLLITLFTNPIQVSSSIAERHGLPPTTGPWFLVLVVGLALTIAWGLFSLSRWGYILTVVYLIYFGSVGLFLSRGRVTTIDFGDFIWSLFVIIYLVVKRKHFFESRQKEIHAKNK